MTDTRKAVLITGCSDGGLGATLALHFHRTGTWRVLATARNASKLSTVQAAGIETLSLDVLSPTSLQAAVEQVRTLTGGKLDMLINNAGSQYYAPLMDLDTARAREMFDINVFAPLHTTRAFLPLLLRARQGRGSATVVVHTSIMSLLSPPFLGIYSASKAAAATLTTALRSELSPFGVRVVELKSGKVQSQLDANMPSSTPLPRTSLYYPTRATLDPLLSTGAGFDEGKVPAETWARGVVAALTSGRGWWSPWSSDTLYFGGQTGVVWILSTFLPSRLLRFVTEHVVLKFAEMRKRIEAYGLDKSLADVYGS